MTLFYIGTSFDHGSLSLILKTISMLVKRNNLMLPSLMNDFFKPDWFGGMEGTSHLPAVNILEHDDNFMLELSIPGFKKEDFNIALDNDVLTISSEVKAEQGTKEGNYTRREFTRRSFQRAFTLPETVDATKINAVYEDGILRLGLPKKEEALPKPKRFIEIG